MAQPRKDYQYLRQWLLDNPLKAIDIAQTAIFGLYADCGKFDKNPEDVEFPSGADYQAWVAETMSEVGVIEAIHLITSKDRAKKLPHVTYWIVSGRVHGAAEDTTHSLSVPEGSTAAAEFARVMYKRVQEGYKEGQTHPPEENFLRDWIHISNWFQITGPPLWQARTES